MTWQLPTGDTLLTAIVAALGGGGLTKIGEAVFGRKGREVKALGDTISIMAEQQRRFDGRLNEAERKVDDCHEQHEACERERQKDRKLIEGLQAKLDQLLRGGATIHRLNAEKRDPGERGEGP